MPRKKQLIKENAELKADLARANEAVVDVALDLQVAREGLAKATPLSPDGLKELAEQYPQWSVNLGMTDSEPSKTFTRDLGDLDPALADERDTYLRFCDPEYFDDTIRDIFKSYYGSGDFSGTAAGEFAGGRFVLDVYPIERLELTVHDANCIRLAEQYLQDTNFGSQPLLESPAPVL
jgi:hypothetical protein